MNANIGTPVSVATLNLNNPGGTTIAGTDLLLFSKLANPFVPEINVISGSHTISAPMGLPFAGQTLFNVGTSLDLSGNISGAGGIFVAGAPSATTILSGTNTFQGNITLSGGSLQVGDGSIGDGNGTISLQGGTFLPTSSYTISNPCNILNPSTINTAGNDLILSGLITATSTWTKAGAGTLELSNTNNSLSQAIIVDEGILLAPSIGVLGGVPEITRMPRI